MVRLKYSTNERVGKENRRENNKHKERKKYCKGKWNDRLKKKTKERVKARNLKEKKERKNRKKC